MNPDLYKVVRLTNNTGFDFTPEMGARYGGVPYLIPAGRSMLMPKPAAKLLAKHLARQVFIQKAPIRDVNQIDGKGSDRPLWTEESCEKLAQSFLSEEYEEERQTPKTDAEILREKIEQLNRLQVEIDTAQGTGSLPIQSGTVATDDVSSEYLDKAQVIAELQKREIKFDARMNKSNLEALLKSST